MQAEAGGTWPFIASIVYSTCWAIASWPQLYLNFKLRSVEGFNLDYLCLNTVGFIFLAIYSTFGYYSQIKGAGTVVVADLIFSWYFVIIVGVQVLQSMFFHIGKNTLSISIVIFAIVLWLMVIVQGSLQYFDVVQWHQYWNTLTVIGYAKLATTLVKYIPPVFWNYKRKSVKGWSIGRSALDLIGGIFSLISGQASVSNGLNLAKLALGIISIIFNAIFIFQRFVLYPEASKDKPSPSQKTQSLVEQ